MRWCHPTTFLVFVHETDTRCAVILLGVLVLTSAVTTNSHALLSVSVSEPCQSYVCVCLHCMRKWIIHMPSAVSVASSAPSHLFSFLMMVPSSSLALFCINGAAPSAQKALRHTQSFHDTSHLCQFQPQRRSVLYPNLLRTGVLCVFTGR